MNAIVLGSAVLLATLAAVQLSLASAFSRRIAARVAWIRAGRVASGGADLPAPVRDFALRCGAVPGGRTARFTQAADLRLKQGAPFQAILATQHVALGEAGFAWDAVRPIGPLPLFRVIDAYDATGGLLEARFLGAIPLAAKSGQDIALGEALRYLAELPWAPDAILGNSDIGWRMTDATHVEASLPVGNAMARVTFSLDARGDFETVEAKDRPAFDAQGRAVSYDWRGHFRDYRRIGDRRVPERAEVGYVYPEGYEAYFRGRVLSYKVLA